MDNLKMAKCPSCGASVKVDPTKEASICEYCGTPFITEKAIINVNNTTNNYYESKKNMFSFLGNLSKETVELAIGGIFAILILIIMVIMIAIMRS